MLMLVLVLELISSFLSSIFIYLIKPKELIDVLRYIN